MERGQGLACALRLPLLYGTVELDGGVGEEGGHTDSSQRGTLQAVEDTQEPGCKLVVVRFSGLRPWV